MLPYRMHDIIRFPLPGVDALIVHVSARDPDLAQAMLDDCNSTLSQQSAARRALAQIQSQILSDIAGGRSFETLNNGDLPFLPASPPPDSPLAVFQQVVSELCAAQNSGHQYKRVDVLNRAERLLRDLRYELLDGHRSDYLDRWLPQVVVKWLDVVRAEQTL